LDAARLFDLELLIEQSHRLEGRTIRFDGVIRDVFRRDRGYWEAKDQDDKLEDEIAKKFAAGYPNRNILFEDSQQAILYQHGERVGVYDLNQPDQVVQLLNTFFTYTEPMIEKFDHAVDRFRSDAPDLANGLKTLIADAHKNNKAFKAAFTQFHELCQKTLNPNLSPSAVDEMLIQHLLTERLMRTVFNRADFTRRNVIAAEVEKVIDALTSQSFSRDQFLGQLDYFYEAIEQTASTMRDFIAKQQFINTVYERFFQGYAVKVADTHGIIYTPQEIVDFMCAAVEEILENEFQKSLWHEDVCIIDPATGTGNFIVNLLRRIKARRPDKLEDVYQNRLFANEVMLMPYYIASLNIEHEFMDLSGHYAPFEGLCFVDTLDLAEGEQMKFDFMTEKNTQRVERQKGAPITVIIGNPPYNVGQINENDNNKNRAYAVIDGRIRDTYVKDSHATNKNAVYDAYVRFFRWASDRLQGRDGIVCYVTNNGFVDSVAFDGFRKHLLQDFTQVYQLDLTGNARTSGERRRKEGGNVFKDRVRVGVGITLAIRSSAHDQRRCFYNRVPDYWKAEQKLEYLKAPADADGRLNALQWSMITPNPKHTWLIGQSLNEFENLIALGTKETKKSKEPSVEAIFKTYGRGVSTCRDAIVYQFDREQLIDSVQKMGEAYNIEIFRYQRAGKPKDVDNFVRYEQIKWSRDLKLDLVRGNYAEFSEVKVRSSVYRPFSKRFLFFDRVLNEEVYVFPRIFPTVATEQENRVICLSAIGNRKSFHCLITNVLPDLHLTGDSQCFPFYTYDEDGSNRRENITDWALKHFQTHYHDSTITKWDIFYYVYGVLHHLAYREKYADNLKRDLPRVPYLADFRSVSAIGSQLADLHLNYETIAPYDLQYVWKPDRPVSYRVEKLKLSKDRDAIAVNDSLTLKGIPAAAFDYRLGNRSALEWIIEQYQVKKDDRSGIVSDPNRYSDDPQYIVNLIGRVTQVSLETMRLIGNLPNL
jgi:predicted helicase